MPTSGNPIHNSDGNRNDTGKTLDSKLFRLLHYGGESGVYQLFDRSKEFHCDLPHADDMDRYAREAESPND